MPTRWLLTDTYILLDIIKEHPILYDKTHENYSNRDFRDAAFKEIIQKLKDKGKKHCVH